MAALIRIKIKHFLNYFLIALFFIPIALFYTQPVHAQTLSASSGQASTPTAVQSTVYSLPSTVSPTSPLYTDLLVNNLFHSFSCLAVGSSIIGQPCLTYQLQKDALGAVKSVPVLSQTNLSGGALGATTSLIGMLYLNPPVRTADYLASITGNFGVVREAHAQVGGSGAAVLSPIISLWQVSRNISYVIMIIIFVIIGLMVMFRQRINPQTVITAQAALPGLVIGLILITFSYFLAGLVSDMAFVGTNVVGYYFVAAQGKTGDPTFNDQLNLTQKLSGSNILDILGSMTGIIEKGDVANFSGKIFDALGDSAKDSVRWLAFWLTSQFLSPLVPTGVAVTSPWGLLIKPIVSLVGGALVSFVAISPLLGLILSFAASLALVYVMIKLLFRLLTAWLTIIFLTITAPFQFLFAALPGRQGIATGWILNMLGNILIFPAVIAVIYFVAFLLGPKFAANCPKDNSGNCLIRVSNASQINNSAFIPPVYAESDHSITGHATFPLFGGIDLSFVNILLAFGALMALPTIPDIITRTVGKAGQAGQMIGQEIMGNANFGRGYSQRSYQAGVGIGQDIQTGLIGQTQVTAAGDLAMSQQGLLRRGVGTITSGAKPNTGPGSPTTPGQWVRRGKWNP